MQAEQAVYNGGGSVQFSTVQLSGGGPLAGVALPYTIPLGVIVLYLAAQEAQRGLEMARMRLLRSFAADPFTWIAVLTVLWVTATLTVAGVVGASRELNTITRLLSASCSSRLPPNSLRLSRA